MCFSLFLFLSVNVEYLTENVKNQFGTIEVFLLDDTSVSQAENMIGSLKEMDGVEDAVYISKEQAMEEFKYNMAFIAQYSVRPGAVASEWDDDVPKEVKRERYHRLTEELMKHSLVYNQGLIGKTVKMLVESQDRKNGYLTGHTEGKIVIRFASRDTSLIGQIVNVKVTSASPLSIEGVLV